MNSANHSHNGNGLTLEQHERLARVAEMYYESHLGQNEIAARLGYSRSMISRLLTEAHERGVVEVRINHPVQRRLDLESDLKSAFNLTHVRVLAHNSTNYADILHRLGIVAASLVDELVQDNMTVGVSWGVTLAEMVGSLRPSPKQGVKVLQLIGSLGASHHENDGPEIARRMARAFTAEYETLPAPLVVESPQAQAALLSDRHIRQNMLLARKADLLILGMGSVDSEYSSLLLEGFITKTQMAQLVKRGAVGDICGLHIDGKGKLIESELVHRTIGIDLESIKKAQTRLGVAGGPAKTAIIQAALRGKLINALVTDESAATSILALTPRKKGVV